MCALHVWFSEREFEDELDLVKNEKERKVHFSHFLTFQAFFV